MTGLSPTALRVLEARYLLRDEEGKVIETPEELFRRVSSVVAGAEARYGGDVAGWAERFFELMSSLRFLPNSPTLMNAGKDIGQLAACFVLPVEDSMKGIFETLKNAALILQSGGGTGFSFSRLRPRADRVDSTGGLASGPVSFMRIYNTTTDVIKQGGARRGANMGILRVDHPDILEFVTVKRADSELLNFNISVAVTDAFFDALRRGKTISLRNPRTGRPVRRVEARLIFDEIVKSAWLTGDPGLIFIDRINRDNPTPQLGGIESTNPCGEQPLLPYEACVLGSLNLARYVLNSILESGEPSVDFGRLERDIRLAVRFLDDCIDVNRYPLPEIEKMHSGNRKIGLGVMGWADMLVLMGIPYESAAAVELARKLMKYVRDVARDQSHRLAEQKGVFPNFEGSIYALRGMEGLRNATTTTVAPTGTLATIANCSSGIEPYFALACRRRIIDTEFVDVNRYFFALAKKRGFLTTALEDEVKRRGNLRGIRGIPRDVRRLFKTAPEIHFTTHVGMQGAFQAYTDNAVSKTINMPKEATKKDVASAFILAYESGCKGITVFRFGAGKPGPITRFADAD